MNPCIERFSERIKLRKQNARNFKMSKEKVRNMPYFYIGINV